MSPQFLNVIIFDFRIPDGILVALNHSCVMVHLLTVAEISIKESYCGLFCWSCVLEELFF